MAGMRNCPMAQAAAWSLAHESRDVLVQVDVVQIRTGGFRDAAAGGVHEFEQGLVP